VVATGYPLEPLREAYRRALDRGLVRRGALEADGAFVVRYLGRASAAWAEALRARLLRITEGA